MREIAEDFDADNFAPSPQQLPPVSAAESFVPPDSAIYAPQPPFSIPQINNSGTFTSTQIGDDSGVTQSHMLGFGLLATGIGAAIGLAYGGIFGGVAGALYGGAVVNGIRAATKVASGDPADDKEAIISGTYAVAGAAFATWLAFKAASVHHNPESSSTDGGLVGVK